MRIKGAAQIFQLGGEKKMEKKKILGSNRNDGRDGSWTFNNRSLKRHLITYLNMDRNFVGMMLMIYKNFVLRHAYGIYLSLGIWETLDRRWERLDLRMVQYEKNKFFFLKQKSISGATSTHINSWPTGYVCTYKHTVWGNRCLIYSRLEWGMALDMSINNGL